MEIKQTSNQIRKGWWEWSLSLDAPADELAKIDKVIYTLHPTFTNPVIERTNPANGFLLKTSGWGTFVVRIDVNYKDGGVAHLRHRLQFQHDKPQLYISNAAPSDTSKVNIVKKVARELGWDVNSADNISPGEDWESKLIQQIDDSQVMVLVGGDTPNRGVMEEVSTAQQLGKTIVPFGAAEFYGLSGLQLVETEQELSQALKEIDFKLRGA